MLSSQALPFYTSAVAHIINITEQSYSSCCRQHAGREVARGKGGRCGEGREEDRKEARWSGASAAVGRPARMQRDVAGASSSVKTSFLPHI